MLGNTELPVVASLHVVFKFQVRGKARPRFGQGGVCYMPRAYMANRDSIVWALRQSLLQYRFSEPFMSFQHGYVQRVIAYRKRRIPRSKKDADRVEKESPLGRWCFGSSMSADLDNFVGTIMDASQPLLYPDDRQIVSSHEDRVWSDDWGADYTLMKVDLSNTQEDA